MFNLNTMRLFRVLLYRIPFAFARDLCQIPQFFWMLLPLFPEKPAVFGSIFKSFVVFAHAFMKIQKKKMHFSQKVSQKSTANLKKHDKINGLHRFYLQKTFFQKGVDKPKNLWYTIQAPKKRDKKSAENGAMNLEN